MEPRLYDLEVNLDKTLEFIRECSLCAVDVAVFPECALTGYALTAEEAASIAITLPGSETARLTEACEQADLEAIVIGTIERDKEGRLFNSALLIGPNGLIASYRKTHLPFLGVDRYLAAGDDLPGPFETEGGRLGMLICYDLRFPEPSRVLSLAGAQVITLPTAWPQAATLYPDFMAQSRAAENGIFLVAANQVGGNRGTRFLGRSVIVSPNGEKLAEGDTEREEILVAEVDLALSDDKNRITVPDEYELYLFDDRRPELYRPLATDQG
jgi:predicted amidohydrolase